MGLLIAIVIRMKLGVNSYLFLSLALMLFLSAATSFANTASSPAACSIALFGDKDGPRSGYPEIMDIYRQTNANFGKSLDSEETLLRQLTGKILSLAPERHRDDVKSAAVQISDYDLEVSMKAIVMSLLSKKFSDTRVYILANRLFQLRQMIAIEDVQILEHDRSDRRYLKIRMTQLITILELQDKYRISDTKMLSLLNQAIGRVNYKDPRFNQASSDEKDYQIYQAYIRTLEDSDYRK